MKKQAVVLIIIFLSGIYLLPAQNTAIPKVYSKIFKDEKGNLYVNFKGKKVYTKEYKSKVNLKNMIGNPTAFDKGIEFDFSDNKFNGKIFYGLINYKDSKHPSPVYFKKRARIQNGKASIKIIGNLSGRYDMISWEKNGFGTLGYRIQNKYGEIMYDGIINFKFKNEKISVAPTLISGPFINKLTDKSVVVWFDTDKPVISKVIVNGKEFSNNNSSTHHEILIDKLKPAKKYEYEVVYDDFSQKYSFTTAHKPGSRKPFVFGYASDSRTGQGGGERNIYGTNFYIMKKNAALASMHNVAFIQFTGDMIDGYSIDEGELNLQYANWKRAIEPFAHYFPIVATVGNHEVSGKIFTDSPRKWTEMASFVTNFPFETKSTAAIFAKHFVNPVSDLVSEDGAYYDPDKSSTDFPPYKETVFYYTYGNVAMVVLNSNYWYSPTLGNEGISGNLHAYIMDNQLKWLEKTIAKLEKDKNIDHIFLTHHTPAFPNGGHVEDDMWYNGDNSFRPIIAGKPVKKGIIERRDEYLNIIVNKSKKVVAMLTGDEHNYNKVKISPDVNIYPEKYEPKKLKRKRTIWQINNGSGGAPYYAQDASTPWTSAVSGFSTQNALVLIYVDGKHIKVKVKNPDTLELIEEYTLR